MRAERLILISQDHDFKQIVRRIPDGAKKVIRNLGPNDLTVQIAQMCNEIVVGHDFYRS